MPDTNLLVSWGDLYWVILGGVGLLALVVYLIQNVDGRVGYHERRIRELERAQEAGKTLEEKDVEQNARMRKRVLDDYKKGACDEERVVSYFDMWRKGTPWENR